MKWEFVVWGIEGVECCYERNGGEQDGRNSEDRMERADTCLVCGAHSRGLAATLDYIRNWLLVSNHSGTGGWWPEASYRALNCPRSSAAASLVSLPLLVAVSISGLLIYPSSSSPVDLSITLATLVIPFFLFIHSFIFFFLPSSPSGIQSPPLPLC